MTFQESVRQALAQITVAHSPDCGDDSCNCGLQDEHDKRLLADPIPLNDEGGQKAWMARYTVWLGEHEHTPGCRVNRRGCCDYASRLLDAQAAAVSRAFNAPARFLDALDAVRAAEAERDRLQEALQKLNFEESYLLVKVHRSNLNLSKMAILGDLPRSDQEKP